MSFADEQQQEEQFTEEYDENGNLNPDPFAEVEPGVDLGEEDLPPGVEPGSLGGVNPSEEAERLKAEAVDPSTVEDPGPGPGPGDELPEDDPLPREDAGLGDEVAPAEEDPLIVGGVQYEEGEEAAMAAANLGQEPESIDASSGPLGGPDEDSATPVGGSEPGAASGIREDQIELQPGQRRYTILRFFADAGEGWRAEEAEHGRLWEEVLDEPIIARSGDLALRKAYRMLVGANKAQLRLVPVPTKFWRPEDVEGEVPAAAMAIRVGKKK